MSYPGGSILTGWSILDNQVQIEIPYKYTELVDFNRENRKKEDKLDDE